MADNNKIVSALGEYSDANNDSSVKDYKAMNSSPSGALFSSSFNTGGALQQLSEFLSMHSKGGSINELKGNTPTIPINDLRGDEAARYSREERSIRCQVAALCRLIDLNGWTNSIYNQISSRCAENEYLVNPFGLLYHEVQASTLVKVNSQGAVLDSGSTVLGVNKAGWNLHAAVHSTRKDIHCVVHVHLPDVVAVSCIKSGLLPVSPEALELLPSVRYHNYGGIITDGAEAESIRADLGNAKVLFLRNRGVTVAASTIPEAWYLMKRIINACQTQMRLLQLGCGTGLLNEFILDPSKGSDVVEPTAESAPNQSGDAAEHNVVPPSTNGETNGDENVNNGVGAKSTSSGVTDMSGWGVGEMEFEAQMRMLDSAGYRTGYAYRNPNLLRRLPTEGSWGAPGTDLCTPGAFLSDTTAAEASEMDDILAANEAGAKQMSKIANTVRSNKQRGTQRNQWLSKTGTGPLSVSQISPTSTAPNYYQSTPMTAPNGYHVRALNGGSVEELSTAAAVPPLDLSGSSVTEKSGRKSGRRGKGKKSTSPFASLNRSKDNHEGNATLEAPRTPPTPRTDRANKSASLPSHARNLVFSARSCNTMEPIDGAVSDNEELKAKAGKKKSKWGSFRLPTFKKRVKQTEVMV